MAIHLWAALATGTHTAHTLGRGCVFQRFSFLLSEQSFPLLHSVLRFSSGDNEDVSDLSAHNH